MNLTKDYLAAAIAIIIVASFTFFFTFTKHGRNVFRLHLSNEYKCVTKTISTRMPDGALHLLLSVNQKVEFLVDYYNCNELKRDHIVAVKLSDSLAPAARIARGVPGDKFRLEKDKKGRGWNIFINEHPVMFHSDYYYIGSLAKNGDVSDGSANGGTSRDSGSASGGASRAGGASRDSGSASGSISSGAPDGNTGASEGTAASDRANSGNSSTKPTNDTITSNEPILKLHERKYSGVIPPDHYILLTYVPRGDADSSTFGLIHKKYILGRAIREPKYVVSF